MTQFSTFDFVENLKSKLFTHCDFAYSYNGDFEFFSASLDDKCTYDLSSLTKVLCTTTLLAIALDEKKISLSDSLKTYLPELQSSKPTIATTLQHSAGFEAWLPLYKSGSKKEFLKEISRSYKEENFLKEVIYSDLGFILLGFLLEEVYKENLSSIFEKKISKPMLETYGYTNLHFNPKDKSAIIDTGLSPHEKIPFNGTVNDDNSKALGGVSGHAGLFGDARSVLQITAEWLLALKNQSSLLSQKSAKAFWTEKPFSKTTRTLGWDGIEPDGKSSAGELFSKNTRGHLGFTGTSLWCDAEKNLIITLLTNRTLLTKDAFDKKPMYEFRKTFHNTLVEEILKEPS